jgi:(p)ppGpp synthase/HD superfamily hydrolase
MRISPVDFRIAATPLKEMEASLLARAIVIGAHEAGLGTEVFEEAIAVAAYAHRTQTRQQRGSMPRVHYIEHPLRNAVRLIRYGVTDGDTLLAAILHDTVEDGPQELAMLGGVNPGDIKEAREAALAFISLRFGEAVERAVWAVSNPLLPKDTTKSERIHLYFAHVKWLTQHARPALVKFTDFVDNAASLHHTVAPEARGKVEHLTRKYAPLVPLFDEVLSSGLLNELLPASGLPAAREHLNSARLNLREPGSAPAARTVNA